MAPPSRSSSFRRTSSSSSAAGHHATSTPAIVIEFGSHNIRLGLSGEPSPRHVLPTPADLSLPSAGRPPASASTPTKSARVEPYGESAWEEVLYPFLSAALTDLLLIKSARSRRVLVLEPFVSPSAFRTVVCRVLLVRLGVASVLFVSGSAGVVLPYGLGLGGGVVVDVGRWEGRAAVVGGGGGGGVLIDTFRAVPCGFDSLAQTFTTAHNNSCPEYCTIPSLEDGRAIVCACLNAGMSSGELQQIMVPSSSHLISVDSKLVQGCVDELYFDVSNPESLVHAFLSALLACPIDMRKDVVRNVVLVGGTVERLPDFERRFVKSVKQALAEPPGSNDGDAAAGAVSARFRPLRPVVTDAGPLGVVHPLPFAPSILPWTSASVMGTLELAHERWVHRQAFVEKEGNSKEKERGESSGTIYDFLSASA